MKVIPSSKISVCGCILFLLCPSVLIFTSVFTDKSTTAEYAISKIQGYRRGAYFSRLTSNLTKYDADKLFNNDSGIEEELRLHLKYARKKKIILVWAPAAGTQLKNFSTNKDECGNCEVTQDRSFISDERTAAVVYYFDNIKVSDMPTPRNPNQLHIYWNMESSATVKNQGYTLESEDSYGMNATMTYRLDSDFLTSYQTPIQFDQRRGDSIFKEILAKKSKMAVCIISNCNVTPGARTRLKRIKKLKSLGLKIDTFGGCFQNKINRVDALAVIPEYKFYFAFENSYHCKDYITEKFFVYAFIYSQAIPVVWGAKREDYEKIAPPGSFIFADDFSSGEHLIEFLEFLNDNDEEYIKFFQWRKVLPEALPQNKRARGFCAICRAIHGINVDYRFNPRHNASAIPPFTDSIVHMTIPSLRRWLYDDDNPECFRK